MSRREGNDSASTRRFGRIPPAPDYSPLVLTPAEETREARWYAAFRAEWEQADADFEIEMAALDAEIAAVDAKSAELEAKMLAYREAHEPTPDAGPGQLSVTLRNPMTPDEFRRRLDLALATGTEMACRLCGRNYRPTAANSACPRCAIYWNRQPPSSWLERHPRTPNP